MGNFVWLVLWALFICKADASSRFAHGSSLHSYDLNGVARSIIPRALSETSTFDSSTVSCSTWGKGAFRTFKNEFYHFISTCNYVLSHNCKGGTEDFNIQIHRDSNGDLERMYIQIEDIIILVVNGTITVQNEIVTLPYDDKVISIQNYGIHIRISNRKHTIALIWNQQDSLSVAVDAEYQGQLCGLCGNFEDTNNIYALPVCPENQIYKDCGPACISTCSDPKPQQQCARCISTCDCPEDEVIIFQQSSMYLQVATTFGLKMQVQITPVLQLYISLSEEAKGSTKGLCGTFNDNAGDDFLTAQGIVEDTAITFVNSWQTQDNCPDATLPQPCISSENEKYAKELCSNLKDPSGVFSTCHSAVDYIRYYDMCVAATCGCEDINDCLCAGLGAYAHECAANGIIVKDWGRDICDKPCTNNHVFEYNIRSCNRSCRSLSEYDFTCNIQDVPVYGCGCTEELYMDSNRDVVMEKYILTVLILPQIKLFVKRHAEDGISYVTCKAGSWQCTDNPCPKSCQVYGDGHYITFDGKRYNFDGNCEYILVEDECNNDQESTLQVLTESVACCENGVTCSRNVKIILEGQELILTDSRVTTVENSRSQTNCTNTFYSLHTVGLYLILTFLNGLTVIWDKHTSLSIILDPSWKNKVCGLCGNFNGNVADDLTTKWNSLVTNPIEFGNSWKSTIACSDVKDQAFPCERNPYCLSWAQRKCSMMKNTLFEACHKKVDPMPYYDACVQEACACDMEGKYLGFCTAVAVYAEACNKAGVCIHWRNPELCPVFCDYYDDPGECSWHYKPCGIMTSKTCSDHHIGKKFSEVLEGCYANCPESAPYLDENTMKCVNLPECTCFYNGIILQPGEITRNDCEEWCSYNSTDQVDNCQPCNWYSSNSGDHVDNYADFQPCNWRNKYNKV
ncbi:mucin-19-like [Callorhinchus milii]|uniref:mucin-19-like n=1 Tax=Callorhinchus milii TaxID=7868 RepID=UPI001C3F58F2|nr:mucin-19-like [Callorhinchus milii]